MQKNDSALPERVLYLDDRFAVVNKKIGEICESVADDQSLSLVTVFRPGLEEALGRTLPVLECAHRIDQPVSGCVVLAFDQDTLAALSDQFAAGSVRKRYYAIVEKRESFPSEERGHLEHLLRFDQKHHKATVAPAAEVRRPGPDWKRVSLDWRLVGLGERYAFLEVTPLTGRTHQIRAQLAAAGMPIKGDLKYGARRSDPLGGIRLHARAIQFRHPTSGDTILVESPIIEPDALWTAFFGAVK
jgi:23S rRNA pseudouridine1911/1915/1917 synthase